MLLARDATGTRIRASRGAQAACPSCDASLIPKCGELVTHHWAHHADRDCDPWFEETEWHRDWKAKFPEDWTEVIVGPHRADVRRPDELTIEFQHSAIAPEIIREREVFYAAAGGLVWVFDAREPASAYRFEVKTSYCDGAFSFVWRHGRRAISACHAPVWLDLGPDQMFAIRKLHTDGAKIKLAGWGYLQSAGRFLERAMRVISPNARAAGAREEAW